jgi:hypothetical protein
MHGTETFGASIKIKCLAGEIMWDSVYLRMGSQSGGGNYYEWEKFDTLKRNTIASGKIKQRLVMGDTNASSVYNSENIGAG